MNEKLIKYKRFLKWSLTFIVLETAFLIVSLNNELFFSKVLINYLLVLSLVPLVIEQIKRGKIDPLSPFAIFSFSYTLLFGIKAVDILVFRRILFLEDHQFYIKALIYAIIGLHFFQIGYFTKAWQLLTKKRQIIKPIWSFKKFQHILSFYSIISIISFLVIIKLSGGFSFYFQNIHAAMVKITSGSALFFMAVLLIEVPLLLWFSYVLELKKNAFAFSLFLALVLFLFFSLGERGHLISLVISLLAIYHYEKKNLTLKSLVLFAVAFILFLSIYGQYREFSKHNISIKRLGFNAKIGLEAVYHTAMADFDQLIRVKDILKHTPDGLDYQLGKTFLNLFFKPIPSRIWDEKPQGAGLIVTKHLYPKHFQAHVTVAPSLIGELYLNFHIVGIILGFFVFGVMSRALYEKLQFCQGNKNFLIIYATLLPFIYSELRGDFAVVTSFLIFKLFFLLLALNYVTVQQNRYAFSDKGLIEISTHYENLH
ncbi:MAG: oligosaccharide repeat unit polymerase [candidate division KSB1 bacterium]|nr:oligosaccharide repeat unit polymerase [candidate division KSB1 bacterium]